MRNTTTRLAMLIGMTPAILLWATGVVAQDDINAAPIHYDTSKPTDAIARLQAKLDSGDKELAWDEQYGWLVSLMELLEVPRESQILVYSKTSLQTTKISPQRPRALYFNDDVYVGTVQLGDLIELSAVDSKLGAVFYSIEQKKTAGPQLVRDDSRCLSCHHSRRTRDVPGYLVRSVYTQSSGHPRFDLGTKTTDLTSGFPERFGGWYVTGTHGAMKHRGNGLLAAEGDDWLSPDKMQNVTDLSGRFDTSRYLTPHSDLVALMVLEHQSQMHNAITRATYEARRAEHYDQTWNKILEKPEGFQHEVSKRRIAAAGNELLKCMLFSDEYPLKSPVRGTSEFVSRFSKQGPRDGQDRSLREFDLKQRLFKYPCSYLIYSDSFASMPPAIHQHVVDRLKTILSGQDTSDDFRHLSAEDRQAIREILSDTLADF